MRRVLSAACALTLLAGCGGGGDDAAPVLGNGNKAPSADAEPIEVVRDWAKAVRTRDYDAANALFAVPAEIANGTPPITLETAGQVDEFNRSLPCGAFVEGAEELADDYLRVAFTLTEGPGCGGNEAEVTFRVVDGRITEWLREAVGPPPGTTET